MCRYTNRLNRKENKKKKKSLNMMAERTTSIADERSSCMNAVFLFEFDNHLHKYCVLNVCVLCWHHHFNSFIHSFIFPFSILH